MQSDMYLLLSHGEGTVKLTEELRLRSCFKFRSTRFKWAEAGKVSCQQIDGAG